MADIRSLILNQSPKKQDVSTPYWSQIDENGNEQVDGHIAIQDIANDVLMELQDARKNGTISAAQFIAGVVTKALMNKDTGAALFQEADRDLVAKLGTTVLQPLFQDVTKFFGINGNSNIEDTKKNLGTIPNATPGIESAKDAYIRP